MAGVDDDAELAALRPDVGGLALAKRGGLLRSTVLPGAVRVSGSCVLYLEGSIVVPR